jgi:general secretion pathway protein G
MKNWSGPYLQKNKVPADPWGHPYHYREAGPSGAFVIFSLGADNHEGGKGEDQDVSTSM